MGANQHVVGRIVFELDQGTLSYRPMKLTLGIEAIAAVGIAAVCLVMGGIVFRARPLAGALNGLDVTLAVGLVLFGVALFCVLPSHHRRSLQPYLIDLSSRTLSRRQKLVLDLTDATSMTLTHLPGYEGASRWQVSCGFPQRSLPMPLLSFSDKADAHRVLVDLTQFLGLPIV